MEMGLNMVLDLLSNHLEDNIKNKERLIHYKSSISFAPERPGQHEVLTNSVRRMKTLGKLKNGAVFYNLFVHTSSSSLSPFSSMLANTQMSQG